MESDEEESRKITIPRFEIKTVDTYGLLCEERTRALRGEPPVLKSTNSKFGLKSVNIGSLMCEELKQAAREQSPAFNSRRHESSNRPQTRSQIDPTYLDLREPTLNVDLPHYNLLGIPLNREPSHIAHQTPSEDVDNLSRKGNVNFEEAGCSSQTVKRTNISDEHALTYKLDKFSENHMIIFNHENFLEDTRREGSAVDVASLRKTFEALRFRVTPHKDLDEAELFTTLKEFSKQDFRRCGCICVAILTHGSDHGFLEAFDGWYSERAVFACFNTVTNKTLTDKPIIFLIQACRGRNLSHGVNVPEPDETPDIQLDSGNIKNAKLSLPAESNMIIFHSSFFGKASARDRHKGSWFIQTVCEQIDLYAASEDLERIFLRVRNIVAREKEAGGRKQMPISSSALTKYLFLK